MGQMGQKGQKGQMERIMSGVLFDVPAKQYKIRARIIQATNNGLELSQKQAQFFIGAYGYDPGSQSISAWPVAEEVFSYPIDQLLADDDPAVAAAAGRALLALEAIGVIMCQRHGNQVMSKLSIIGSTNE